MATGMTHGRLPPEELHSLGRCIHSIWTTNTTRVRVCERERESRLLGTVSAPRAGSSPEAEIRLGQGPQGKVTTLIFLDWYASGGMALAPLTICRQKSAGRGSGMACCLRLKPLSRKTTKRQRKTNAVVLSGQIGHVPLHAAFIWHAAEIRSIMSSQPTPGSIEATAPGEQSTVEPTDTERGRD